MPLKSYKCYIDGNDEQKDESSNENELFLNVGDKLSITNDINQLHTEAIIIDFI